MADRHWTVVFVPEGAGGSRAIRVSLRAFRTLSTAAVLFAVAAVVLGYSVLTRTVDLSHLDRIQRRNQLLAEELEATRAIIGDLRDTISNLAERDEQVRLLAGLRPSDPTVLLAGVGGPAAPWTEREQILSEGPVGRRALDLRRDIDGLVRRANLLAESYSQAVDSLEHRTDRLRRTPSISPITPGLGYFSSPFAAARLHPIFHEARPHEGIDVSAPMGTSILAPASGRIVDVRTEPGYGKTVTVDHGYGIMTRYAHCSRILVRVGQWVNRGEKIAEVGNTGLTTAPHLHYEVLLNGRPVDPRTFIFRSSIVD
jgi:murein DD-endopeptidase MepM/ murein hydrolase activator NlpD